MVSRFLAYDQSIWILMFILYIALHLRIVDRWTAILYFGWHRALRCSIQSFRFSTIFGDIIMLAPLPPWEYCARGSWGRPERMAHDKLSACYRDILRVRATGLCLQVVATASFVVYFIAGPALTALYGLNVAVLWALGFYLLVLVFLGGLFSCFRFPFAFPLMKRLGIWLECLVYPAAMAALPKLVLWGEPFDADFPLLARARARSSAASLRKVIEGRIEMDMQDQDEAGREELQDYLKKLAP